MRRTTLLVIIGLLALGSAPAWAQTSGRLTISPFAGYRTSGNFGISAAVSLKYNALRVSDGFEQDRAADGLGEKVQGPGLHGLDARRDVPVTGKKYD